MGSKDSPLSWKRPTSPRVSSGTSCHFPMRPLLACELSPQTLAAGVPNGGAGPSGHGTVRGKGLRSVPSLVHLTGLWVSRGTSYLKLQDGGAPCLGFHVLGLRAAGCERCDWSVWLKRVKLTFCGSE